MLNLVCWIIIGAAIVCLISMRRERAAREGCGKKDKSALIVILTVVGVFLIVVFSGHKETNYNLDANPQRNLSIKTEAAAISEWLVREGWARLRANRFDAAWDAALLASVLGDALGHEKLRFAVEQKEKKYSVLAKRESPSGVPQVAASKNEDPQKNKMSGVREFLRKGKNEQALLSLREYLEENPNNSDARTLLEEIIKCLGY